MLLMMMMPSRFQSITTQSRLPTVADDYLPSILIHLGILDVSECTLPSLVSAASAVQTQLLETPGSEQTKDDGVRSESLPIQSIVLPPDAAYSIRAAALYACDVIAQVANAEEAKSDGDWKLKVTAAGLSAWFSGTLGQDGGYGKLPVFVMAKEKVI